ncbi:MAG TPA: acyloxyacyl hydrolase, partial [Nitrosopumilaceae archaeon]|nr:acyloxyacyl hydrolase [Nitrosopumilaceae archaeon]
YGFILQHRNNMGNLITGHISGGELNYIIPTKGTKLWHHENNFPEKGITFAYYNLGNPAQLGNLFAIAPFYDIPLNEKKKRFRLYMRLCSGIAYATKTFDPIENHKNNVVSVPLNAYVNFRWFYKFDISPRLRWEAGLNFAHASNGKYKAPNLGINMLTLNTGITWKFTSKNPTTFEKNHIDSSTKAPSRHEIYTLAAFGINEIEPPGGSKYLAQTYILGYYYNLRNTHKFGGGLDFYYGGAVVQEIYQQDSIKYSNKLKYVQVGAKFSYCYNVGRTSFPVEFGYYVSTPYKGDGMFFHRIGVRHYTQNNIILNFSLKTHWAVASYFEFGLGYRLPLKRKTLNSNQ